MESPRIPENEEERLKVLSKLKILDISNDENGFFDSVTRLSSEICNVPISLITLIDEKRQWFRSHHGTDFNETPREISFCGHAINGKKVFYVSDAILDKRFEDNPLVTGEPKIRFYAGYPLSISIGINLGTLCVIDHEPRQLNDKQLAALNLLGKQVVHYLKLKLKHNDCQETLKELKSKE